MVNSESSFGNTSVSKSAKNGLVKLNKLYHNVHCFAHYAAIAHLHAAAEDVTLHSILFL